MVTFDRTHAAGSVAAWGADQRFCSAPTLDLDGVSELVVVAAHPDDETLGAGGLIAECAARGIGVHVVVVTDGAASHPDSTTVTPGVLAKRRSEELAVAIAILAPNAIITMLHYPDGRVREDRDYITTDLSQLLARLGPTSLLTAPWRGDGHRDHRIIGEICADIAGRTGSTVGTYLEYPVWMWHWASPGDPDVPLGSFLSLPLGINALAAKVRAIQAHESQVRPLSPQPGDESVLQPDFLEHFLRGSETFIETDIAHAPAVSSGAASTASDGPASLPGEYFDDLYARHDDPWQFDSRWYERRKRAVTLASLPHESYESVLEIGCSIGVLTAELAARATKILGVDVSPAAIERAGRRLAEVPHASVRLADVADDFPAGSYDLIVLSEVGYYFDPATLGRVLDNIERHLAPGGTLLACHWRHPVDGYLQSGDAVHSQIARRITLNRVVHHVEEDYALDVFSTDPRSVARKTGLLS